MSLVCILFFFFLLFFFNDTATTEIYTLSLHDALPIFEAGDFYILCPDNDVPRALDERRILWAAGDIVENRSEEHTSELQSQFHLVCRLLLEKKKKKKKNTHQNNLTSHDKHTHSPILSH